MNGDAPVLIVGLLIAAGLMALAFAILRRSQLQVESDRLSAARQEKLANATLQRTAEDLANRHADNLRKEIAARLEAIEAHVNALYEQAGPGNAPSIHAAPMTGQVSDAQAARPSHGAHAPRVIEMEDHSADPFPDASLFNPPLSYPPLSGPQRQALAHVYWELDALSDAVRRKAAGIVGPDDRTLAASEAAGFREWPPLPITVMRTEITVMGHDAVERLSRIADALDWLRATEGATRLDTLRGLLGQLEQDIGELLHQLRQSPALQEA